MRRIRLYAAAALAGLGLIPAAAGVADASSMGQATAARPAANHPEVSMWSENWGQSSQKIYATCPDAQDLSTGGAEYVVNADGVHLRSTPGGKWESAIGQGKLFESDWIVGSSVYQCTASAAGKTWLLGISASSQVGWVQTDDLTFVGGMNPDPSS
jgi:hypothetical protein